MTVYSKHPRLAGASNLSRNLFDFIFTPLNPGTISLFPSWYESQLLLSTNITYTASLPHEAKLLFGSRLAENELIDCAEVSVRLGSCQVISVKIHPLSKYCVPKLRRFGCSGMNVTKKRHKPC